MQRLTTININPFGVKAKMLTVDQVSEMIGHEVGGVCPMALKKGVKVYLMSL